MRKGFLREFRALFTGAVLLCLLFTMGCDSHDGQKAATRDFTLPDLNGNEVALSDFRGKVVMLEFWAIW